LFQNKSPERLGYFCVIVTSTFSSTNFVLQLQHWNAALAYKFEWFLF